MKRTEHPQLCVCVACEAEREAALVQVISVNPGLADRANGHPVNCVCVDCVAGDMAAAVVQQNPAPIGGGVERKEQRKWR